MPTEKAIKENQRRKAEYESIVGDLMGMRALYQAECIHCGVTVTGRSRHELLKSAYRHLGHCDKYGKVKRKP